MRRGVRCRPDRRRYSRRLRGPRDLHRDLRLPDERRRQRADARRTSARTATRTAIGAGRGRRHPAQHLRDPRARRGARPRPARRARAPQARAPATCMLGCRGCMAQHHRATICSSASRRSTSSSAPTATAACRSSSTAARAARDAVLVDGPARRRAARSRRDLRRPRPGARDGAVRAWITVHARLRQVLHLLRRAVRARPRAQPARPRRSSRRCATPPRDGAPRGRVPRADRQRLPRRRAATSPTCCARTAEVDGIAPHPLHLAASRRHERRADRARWRVRRGRARSCTCRCSRDRTPVLARMERGYTVAAYRDLVARLRAAVPGLALSTDIIVGFPGEIDDDFEATCRLLAEVRYDQRVPLQVLARDARRAPRSGPTRCPRRRRAAGCST